MPLPEAPITTIQQLRALGEDEAERNELLEGVHVVTPYPQLRHQAVLSRLMHVILDALADDARFAVFPGGEVVPKPDTLVIPDLLVLAQDPNHPATSWDEAGVPVLAVEILSPSTAARDRGIKRRIYQEAGVSEYWIVDIDAQMIERWRPEDERPEIIDVVLEWQPAPEVTIRLPLDRLFTGGARPA